jgi:hypothetical protein
MNRLVQLNHYNRINLYVITCLVQKVLSVSIVRYIFYQRWYFLRENRKKEALNWRVKGSRMCVKTSRIGYSIHRVWSGQHQHDPSLGGVRAFPLTKLLRK